MSETADALTPEERKSLLETGSLGQSQQPPQSVLGTLPQLTPDQFANRIRVVGEATPSGETSSAGARGQMQVVPGTAADPGFGVRPAADSSFTELNRVGVDYAKALYGYYGGNVALASVAYNAGPGRTDQWLQQYGDPRTGRVSEQQWLDALPIEESKQYGRRMVQGVQPIGMLGAGIPQGQQGKQNPLTVQATAPQPVPTAPQAVPTAPVAPQSKPPAASSPNIGLALLAAALPQHQLVPVHYDPFKNQQGLEAALPRPTAIPTQAAKQTGVPSHAEAMGTLMDWLRSKGVVK